MERGCFVIFIIVAFLAAAGLIVGGSILCWRSTMYHVCSDWEYHNPLYTCDTIYKDPIAPTQCNNTLCYCRSPTYDYKCYADPPGGVSPSLLTGGIMMIVISIVFIGIAIFMFAKIMNY